jgi:hypothetical protein
MSGGALNCRVSKMVSTRQLFSSSGLSLMALLSVPANARIPVAAPWGPIANQIETIVQAQGTVSNNVFSIEIDRNDINNVTLHGVPIKASFQINGALVFQQLGGSSVLMNGDMALKASEVVPFIDKLIANRIVFQAEHQHFYDFSPMVWFIHFRGTGDAQDLARRIKSALDVTSTPFPQTIPANPTTPLPTAQLAAILGGSASVGSDGVVTVDIPRDDSIFLGGYHVSPFLNVETSIVFEPHGGGRNAAVAPDFGMTSWEVQNVTRTMRSQGWDVGCLYNQETNEDPQLFFSHMFKVGDSVQLAMEIRRGLNNMHMKFTGDGDADDR